MKNDDMKNKEDIKKNKKKNPIAQIIPHILTKDEQKKDEQKDEQKYEYEEELYHYNNDTPTPVPNDSFPALPSTTDESGLSPISPIKNYVSSTANLSSIDESFCSPGDKKTYDFNKDKFIILTNNTTQTTPSQVKSNDNGQTPTTPSLSTSSTFFSPNEVIRRKKGVKKINQTEKEKKAPVKFKSDIRKAEKILGIENMEENLEKKVFDILHEMTHEILHQVQKHNKTCSPSDKVTDFTSFICGALQAHADYYKKINNFKFDGNEAGKNQNEKTEDALSKEAQKGALRLYRPRRGVEGKPKQRGLKIHDYLSSDDNDKKNRIYHYLSYKKSKQVSAKKKRQARNEMNDNKRGSIDLSNLSIAKKTSFRFSSDLPEKNKNKDISSSLFHDYPDNKNRNSQAEISKSSLPQLKRAFTPTLTLTLTRVDSTSEEKNKDPLDSQGKNKSNDENKENSVSGDYTDLYL